ncbi:MAG: NADH-quinone oxidoreductase subunit C [Candidatus Thermoplasmatota archaeon]|nr:NADH-quinone oxidoreductase subunit C [Candidatus Thermoplasmatota archaeon]
MDTKETKLLDEIKSKFNVEGKIQRERRIWIAIDEERLIELCNWLKNQSFEHLSAISVTDWVKEGRFEVTYHLWSYKDKILLTLKTKIDRKKPVIESVTTVWEESAQIHERELHELFGVKFKGNSDLSPLFLEDWHAPPPFRKDFDWREYVREEHYDKENEREVVYYD